MLSVYANDPSILSSAGLTGGSMDGLGADGAMGPPVKPADDSIFSG
jgi:hypothetical protein